MFKKILLGLLSVVMVISVLNISVFAASLTLQADKVEVQQGETSAVVAINLSSNPGIATIGFDVTYDSNVMTLKSVDCGDVVTAAEITAGDLNKNPYTVGIPYTTDAVDKLADNTNNGTLVSLNFEINADCTPGEYEISLSEGTLGGALNMAEDWVDMSISNGSITVVGKTISSTTTTESTTITTTEKATEATTKAPVTQATTEKATEVTTKAPVTQITTEKVTETTTKSIVNENTTETTTVRQSSSGSSGSSGGGAGASSISVSGYTAKVTTTEATTETTTKSVKADSVTETTTEKAVSVNNVKVTIGSKTVIIGDESYDIDVAPYIQSSSNSTLVPLRFVALAIADGNIDDADNSENILWDNVNKTATIIFGNKTIKFTAGSNTMVIDGKQQIMDNGVKAEITDGRMFVPFRALGNALGVDVEWDTDTKTATYSTK